MDSNQKENIRRQILDESVFGPMVDKTFNDADLDKSGFIEKAELAILLKGIHASLGLSPPTQKDIQSEMKRLDLNTDGKISKDEFRTLVKELALFSIEQM